MNVWLLAAAVLSGLTFAIHTWVGGPKVVPALFAAQDLRNWPRHIFYFCWHLITIVLLFMALGLLASGLGYAGRDVAIFIALLCAAFALWGLGLIVRFGQKLWKFPQWMMFLSIALVALPGL